MLLLLLLLLLLLFIMCPAYTFSSWFGPHAQRTTPQSRSRYSGCTSEKSSFDYRQGKWNNLFSKESGTNPVIHWIAGSLSKREKLPWREADDSPHSVPKLRMRAATPTRPHMSLWHAEGQLYLCHNHGSSDVKIQLRLASIFGVSDSKWLGNTNVMSA